MIRKILTGVLAAALTLTGLYGGNALRADEPKQEVKKETKKGVLTDESLKEMLENMGYTPEVIRNGNGQVFYKISMKSDGWDFIQYVTLSTDKTNVWFLVSLADVPDDLTSVEPLKKLLAENNKIGPCHFTLDGKTIWMRLQIANSDVTPARLRTSIDTMNSNVKSTYGLWNTSAWPRKDVVKVEEKK
jgi:hypothetical protein